MDLPEDFVTYTKRLFGEERWQHYLDAFNEVAPVSVRVNPFKCSRFQEVSGSRFQEVSGSRFQEVSGLKLQDSVPWCRNAYYLRERPNFTLDPLLHAGAYYVQEASSMFLDEVLRNVSGSLFPEGESCERLCLDLCAAPGGKSTLLRAALPDDVLLYSNEPDRRRANILMENMQKQGHPNVIVTNNYPRDYRKSGILFDLILTDVPCSGEGMFRKDEGAIKEWSLQNVMKCQQLQRSIVEDIWPCLKDGGILVYSTCTFNTSEDEENVMWIMENLGAEILPIQTKPEWNITGSLLPESSTSSPQPFPVYRFIPGTTRGEGLFMAVLRKKLEIPKLMRGSDPVISLSAGKLKNKGLRVLSDGKPVGTVKGKNVIPAHAEALLVDAGDGVGEYGFAAKDKYPIVELSLEEAQKYLHYEALVLPSVTPRGFVIVTYKNLPLGFVKNIGNRANNLYPAEWKIRNLLC